MIGNNSSGSHSIVYGTTIDHVHELESCSPTARPPRSAATPARHLKDGLREILRDHADAIEPATRALAPVRRLPARPPRARLQPRQARHRLGGTLVAITEATVGLVPLPKAKLFAVGHFHSLAAIAATEDALERMRPRSR